VDQSIEEKIASVRALTSILRTLSSDVLLNNKGSIMDCLRELSTTLIPIKEIIEANSKENPSPELIQLYDEICDTINQYHNAITNLKFSREELLERSSKFSDEISNSIETLAKALRKKINVNPVVEEILLLKKLKEKLEEENIRLSKRLYELKKLITTKDHTINSLNTRLKECNMQLETLKSQKESKLTELIKEREILKNRIKKLEEALSKFKQSVSAEQVEKYKLELSKLKAATEEIKRRYSVKLQKIVSERDEWMKKALDKTVKSLKEIFEELEDEIKKLKDENSKLLIQNEKLKKLVEKKYNTESK